MEMRSIYQVLGIADTTLMAKAERIAQQRYNERLITGRLTRREILVLQLLSKGLTTPEICDMLGTAESTVRSQYQSIFQKINVTSALQAVVFAYRTGICDEWVDPTTICLKKLQS